VSKSNFAELELLKHNTGQVNAFGTPITPWLALFTANPTESGAGTEVSTGGYARIDSTGSWGAPSSGAVTNSAQCSFGVASASIPEITGFALFDAPSGGNMWRWSALEEPKPVFTDDPYYFDPGQLTFTED
jgi:hypothetical protein